MEDQNTQQDISYIPEEEEALQEGKAQRIKKELKACQKEKREYLEGWQRARADFQNYKKEQDADMFEFRKFAASDVILRILPVLDNLNLARDSFPVDARETPWAKGILNVKRQFEAILSEYGLQEILVSKGDKFDPFIHESIGEVEEEGESGSIGEMVQRGYMMQGKILRPVRVRIVK